MMILILIARLLLMQNLAVQGEVAVTSDDPTYLACPGFSITEERKIASPLYPDYPPNFYCEYNIQAPKDRYVVIEFDQFSFPQRSQARRGINYERVYPRCEKDFVEISDDYEYINRFRYCGTELNKRTFESQGSSVKLTLQMMDSTFRQGGFKASVKFPVRDNFETISTTCSQKDSSTLRCKAPLKRVMTPESSVDLIVDYQGTIKNCSSTISMTTENLEYMQKVPPDHVMALEMVSEACLGRTRYPSVLHMTEPDTVVYDVRNSESQKFGVILKQFSTRQKTMCGGHIHLKRDEPFRIKYSGVTWNKQQTCMWILHADPSADKIQADISKFTFNGDNNDCINHHLSMMHVGVNMFEILKYELREPKNSAKYKRTCNQINGKRETKEFSRPNRDIFGAVSVMVLLSHSSGFFDFDAQFKSANAY